ncbi:MAG: helix-turn-helix transcriptional regulator, partial [Firmicutes bacterium]|nr:helix-turn-helix transcriptional regulator [Bacillota bacterium]
MTSSSCVGERIRARRLKLGMTQQELAGEMFTKSFISQIEKNHARPSLKSLQTLATRLGKPMAYFLDEEHVVPSTDPDKIDHLAILAARLRQGGQYADALNYYKEALSLTEENDHSRRGHLLSRKGSVYRDLDQPDKALEMLERAQAELDNTKDWEQISRIHNELGDLLLFLDQVDTAVSAFETALD